MAPESPSRLLPVRCAQLQLGMFVAELDRSWLHTPFPAGGFLLTTPGQLEQLRRSCEYVYVDPLLSEGDSGECFATGLTGRVRALQERGGPVSGLDRARETLHALGHGFAVAVRDARRADALALAPLRQSTALLVDRLLEDPDAVTWLLATEVRLPQLHRRALGGAVFLALLAHRLGFGRQVQDELALAGLLLDIGKISVPVTILARPGRLSGHELAFVRRHVRRGLYLVGSAAILPELMEAVMLAHHERLDGSGYPRGLRGTDIPLAGRMAAITDTYDALTQDRRYAAAAAPHDAMRLVHAGRGSLFDAAMVRGFVQALGVYPTGSWVQLKDGRLGIVRSQTEGEPARPRVALVAGTGRDMATVTTGSLWRPAGHRDILRALAPAEVGLSRPAQDEVMHSAANLAA